jgi:hypothetical protein
MLWLALLAQALPPSVPHHYQSVASTPAGRLVDRWRSCTTAVAHNDALVSNEPAENIAAAAEHACEPAFTRLRDNLTNGNMALSSDQVDATMQRLRDGWRTRLIDDIEGLRFSRKVGHGLVG